MKLLIVAVGQRVPDWAQTAYDDYAKRFPPELKVELKAVKTEPRGSKTLETLTLGGVQRLQRLGATRLGLHSLELHFEFRWKTLGVVVVGSLCPIGHPLPHGNNQQLHGST